MWHNGNEICSVHDTQKTWLRVIVRHRKCTQRNCDPKKGYLTPWFVQRTNKSITKRKWNTQYVRNTENITQRNWDPQSSFTIPIEVNRPGCHYSAKHNHAQRNCCMPSHTLCKELETQEIFCFGFLFVNYLFAFCKHYTLILTSPLKLNICIIFPSPSLYPSTPVIPPSPQLLTMDCSLFVSMICMTG